VAEIITGLDRALPRIEDQETVERLGAVGQALAEPALIERLVSRLGEARIPPTERGFLVGAVGALAELSMKPTLRAFLAAPAELREPYRAAIRVAADRAVEALESAVADPDERIAAAAAHFIGLTGSPETIPLLAGLLRHPADTVREAALYAMAEIGGKEIARPAVAALRDPSAPVRAAATRVIGVGGDPSATQVLVRRLEHEEDEGVLAGILTAVGRLGAPEASTCSPSTRSRAVFSSGALRTCGAAAIEGIGYLHTTEARRCSNSTVTTKSPRCAGRPRRHYNDHARAADHRRRLGRGDHS
jgi:hypothetical protein